MGAGLHGLAKPLLQAHELHFFSIEPFRRTAQSGLGSVKALGLGVELAVHDGLQCIAPQLEVRQQLRLRHGAHFGSSCRRGGTQVSTKVGNGEVGFMTNTADNWHWAGHDGTG